MNLLGSVVKLDHDELLIAKHYFCKIHIHTIIQIKKLAHKQTN